MSSDFTSKLITDRVEFKLFAAQTRLHNLQQIKLNSGNMEKIDPNIQMEMEIDCFLSQIIGVIDCLLELINARLELGIAAGRADPTAIQSALNSRTKNISLITELHLALEHNRWLWTLKEFRNQTMQKPSKQVLDLLLENKPASMVSEDYDTYKINWKEFNHKNLIEYFEKSVKRVRELVDTIRIKEPLLK